MSSTKGLPLTQLSNQNKNLAPLPTQDLRFLAKDSQVDAMPFQMLEER